MSAFLEGQNTSPEMHWLRQQHGDVQSLRQGWRANLAVWFTSANALAVSIFTATHGR